MQLSPQLIHLRRLAVLVAALWAAGVAVLAQQGAGALTERERALLDRIQALEERVADLEAHRTAATSASTAPASASTSGASAIAAATSAPQPDLSATAGKPALPGLAEGTILNFLLDGYYEYNFNQPVGRVNLLPI